MQPSIGGRFNVVEEKAIIRHFEAEQENHYRL